jgi:hypothetical protein
MDNLLINLKVKYVKIKILFKIIDSFTHIYKLYNNELKQKNSISNI